MGSLTQPFTTGTDEDLDELHKPVEVRIVRTLGDVERIRSIWSSWPTHRDCDIDFCLRVVWSRPEFIRPHVIVIYRGGKPEAALVGRLEYVTIHSKVGYLRLPGIRARVLVFSYHGSIGNGSQENAELFVESIMQTLKNGEASAAFLHNYSTSSPLFRAAQKQSGFLTRDHLSRPSRHFFMRLDGGVDEAFRQISSGLRAEIRRKKKKMIDDFGDKVELQSFHGSDRLDGALDEVEQIAAKTYQRRLGVGFQHDDFTRRRLHFCAERGWLRLYVLRLDGRPCAFWMGTVYEGSFCSDDIGFDPQFSRYSPGTVLLGQIIEEFCRETIQEIDFGPGEAEYKERFGRVEIEESSPFIFAPTLAGLGLNVWRTSTGLTNALAHRALGGSTLPAKIKSLWRSRLVGNKGKK